jgi:hypothetical protein
MSRVHTPAGGQPAPKRLRLPPWPGRLAHIRSGDPAIYVQASPVLSPADAVDLRCPACFAGSEIGLDHEYQLLVFMIHHAAGCTAIRDRLQMAGVAS